ncbi:MAG: DUF2569 domain-containing protein [Verrucomicrobiae bacterium]|nr:DUF2569 domain-containing protein [Verrucomicrobiae bacterium]
MRSSLHPDPEGIGGWLILPMLGFLTTPFMAAYNLIAVYFPMFSDGTWVELTVKGKEAYHHLWGPVLIYEMAGYVFFFFFAIVVNILFFMRNRALPNLAVALYLGNLAFVAIDQIYASRIPGVVLQDSPESANALIRAGIGTLIWMPYFLVSRRVKNTFVN